MHSFNSLLTAAVAVGGVAADNFNLLRHVGGNGQWFPGTVDHEKLPNDQR